MTKKTEIALVAEPAEVKTANVHRFDLAQALPVAQMLAIDLTSSLEDRADQAAAHANRSQRHMLAAGMLLASLKAECEHGQFTSLIAARGFEDRAARTAMQYAGFILSRPEEQRQALVELHHTKVMRMASADPEVLEVILADGIDRIDALSVRALQTRLRELEAQTVDLQVQRDTAEAQAEAMQKQLKRGLPTRADDLPLVVAELRAEVMALGKKASLSLDGFHGVAGDLMALVGSGPAHQWADATLRLGVAQLSALAVQLNGLLRYYATALPGEDLTPVANSQLTKQEVLEAAQRFAELTQVHEYERTLRDWERAALRPKGKGRPKDKPAAPGASGSAS